MPTLLIAFIPALVKIAEELFAKLGTKTGPQKLSWVQNALQLAFVLLGNLGIIPKETPAPTADTLQGAIEAILLQIKNSGGFNTQPVNPGQLYLLQGSITALNSDLAKKIG